MPRRRRRAGGEPAAVVDLVRERCTLILGGNHDRWVAGTLTTDMLPLPRQRAELRWQAARLGAEQREWLRRLESASSRHGVELWHGSAADPVTGLLASDADARDHFARQRSMIGLVGHTHRPLFAALRHDVAWDEQPARVAAPSPAQVVMNPGAVLATGRWLCLDLGNRTATWRASPPAVR